jgi:uncharacterized repeat protein (TIGR01451 family)
MPYGGFDVYIERGDKMRRVLPFLLSLLGLAWALTPAGTVIRNQAEAWVGGERHLSNPVITLVQGLCVPNVAPDGTISSPGQDLEASQGGVVYFAYRVANLGNTTSVLYLDYEQQDNGFLPDSLRLFLDINEDGRPDPGESSVPSLNLVPGEARRVGVEVRLPSGASGSYLFNLRASCTDDRGLKRDDNNWARVRVKPPVLQLIKGVAPTAARPGEVVAFRLRLYNLGGEAVGTIYLTDDLAGLPLAYVPGSARASLGQVEFYDESAWTPLEPASPRAIRLVLSGLPQGGVAELTFQARVLEAPPQVLRNLARAEGPGGPAEGAADLEVLPLFLHHLGPLGNPRALPGGEGSPDDRQAKEALQGARVCFLHTLENAGTVAEAYALRVEGLPSGVGATFLTPSGTPLANPLSLNPGERADFQVCYQGFTAPFAARVVARGGAGENATWDEVSRVHPVGSLTLRKAVDPAGTVRPGDLLTYTLTVENALGPMEVEVRDPLDPHLEFVSASHGGTLEGGEVVWRLTLPMGTTTLTLQVRVKAATPDDTLIRNQARLLTPLAPDPLPSNPVENPVWGAGLLIQKEVRPWEVQVGDVLTYTLRVANPAGAALEIQVVDTPDPRLQYVEGSATRGCQNPVSWPVEVREGKLHFAPFTLPAGGTECLSYRMRLRPGPAGEFINVAQAFGVSGTGAAIASAQAQALVRLRPGVFEEKGLLLGRVFLDLDEDGLFSKGDIPLPGARLLLPGGFQVLTDAEGRYAFRDLSFGVHQVMLDATTAPFPPRPHPEALGEGYRHRVPVYGLAVSDFPLALDLRVKVRRSTTLRMGPLTVEKRVVEAEGATLVVLTLKTAEPLPEFRLTDPVPGGEDFVFEAEVFEGEKTLSYRLPEGAPFTDPEVRWRYP